VLFYSTSQHAMLHKTNINPTWELGSPSISQATWKKASPKSNSQAKNSENNPNNKQSPKHKAKSRLCAQKLLQQQPKKEKNQKRVFTQK
jgi:hypothetical protein